MHIRKAHPDHPHISAGLGDHEHAHERNDVGPQHHRDIAAVSYTHLLDKLAEAVKAGVRMAGGTPSLVPSIGVGDGIAMGHIGMKYSLPSRELICDSVETMARAHGFDGLVLVPNCDKIVPGMLMAAARLNIPSIVVSGGPMRCV